MALKPLERSLGNRCGCRRKEHVGCQCKQRITLIQRPLKPIATHNEGRENIARTVLVRQLGQCLGPLVQQHGHTAAQYKRGPRVARLFTAKNHRKDAKFDIGCARGMRNTRGKLSAAGLGIIERLVLAQTLAHGVNILDTQLIGQK